LRGGPIVRVAGKPFRTSLPAPMPHAGTCLGAGPIVRREPPWPGSWGLDRLAHPWGSWDFRSGSQSRSGAPSGKRPR
jgi:hypothetical protein